MLVSLGHRETMERLVRLGILDLLDLLGALVSLVRLDLKAVLEIPEPQGWLDCKDWPETRVLQGQ